MKDSFLPGIPRGISHHVHNTTVVILPNRGTQVSKKIAVPCMLVNGMWKSAPLIPKSRVLSVGSSNTESPEYRNWFGLIKDIWSLRPCQRTWLKRIFIVSPVVVFVNAVDAFTIGMSLRGA